MAVRRDTNRNARLITRLLSTQQLISSAIEALDDCLERYVQDGVDLNQYN